MVGERESDAVLRRLRYVLARLARPVLTGTGLVVAYYLLPLDRRSSAGTVAGLVVGLVLTAGLLAWQTVMITRSGHPRLRAVETVATVFSLFVLLFSTAYFMMERTTAGTFNEPLSRTDALYFTIATFATVGYGDLVPVTQAARVTVLVQMLGDLLLVGVAVRVIVGAVRTGLGRGGPPTGRPASGP